MLIKRIKINLNFFPVVNVTKFEVHDGTFKKKIIFFVIKS